MLHLRATLVALFTLLVAMPAEALTPCQVDGKLIYTRECIQRQNTQVTDELHRHQLQVVRGSTASASHAPGNAPSPAEQPGTRVDQPQAALTTTSSSIATPPTDAAAGRRETPPSVVTGGQNGATTTPARPSATTTPGTSNAAEPTMSAPQRQPDTSVANRATPSGKQEETRRPNLPDTDLSHSLQPKPLPAPTTPIRAEDCASARLFRAVEHDHLRLLQQCQSPQLLLALSNSGGRTLLHQAAAYGSLQSLEYLLAQHAQLESRARGDKGATPLHLAAEHNQVTTLRALVQAGANLEARDYLKRTPLHRANAERATDSVAALIQLGADLNSVDRAQQTPLLVASQQLQSAPLLAQLIDAGAKLNHTNYRDMTALHYAVMTDTASTRLLVERKIDLNRLDSDGRTAILLAASEGIDSHWERIKLLVEAGANLNLKDKTGNTLLKLAYNNQHEEFLKLLLRHGVDSRNVVRVIENFNKK